MGRSLFGITVLEGKVEIEKYNIINIIKFISILITTMTI